MASPGGDYSSGSGSGSSSLQNSGSEVQVMDQKKRKRMLSNRESARRSRMRKQQHVEELSAQVEQLKKDNNQISNNIGVTTQMYMNVEGENAILRVQMAELTNRLQSLNEIIHYIESTNNNNNNNLFNHQTTDDLFFNDCGFVDTWNSFSVNQPMMASADMLMY